MRLFNLYLFVALLFSLLIPACDVHEFPEEEPLPPAPGEVSFDLQLDFAFDRAELPHYKTIAIGSTRAADLPSYNARYQIRVFRMGADSLFEATPCETIEFNHVIAEALDYRKSLRLKEGRYRFMAWTDFSENMDDCFYSTTDFSSIALLGDEHVANNDFRDAFRGVVETDLRFDASSGRVIKIDMLRPLAKFRFETIDIEQFKSDYLRSQQQSGTSKKAIEREEDIDMTKFSVRFSYVGFMPSVYNMYTDRPVDVKTGVSFPSVLTDIKDGEATMGFDYVMVGDGDAGVSMAVAIFDKDGKCLSGVDNIQVPLQRGKLTVVRGNFLTSRSSGNVQIDPSFDGEFDIEIR